ncbi:D-alanine--D-alanine ligase [Rhodanobacter sp. Soil772]|uniref:D-alanine--D-alanine ligase n=1 Tax=Rhodanobacter sp. Soil772 TaxID=1736406 RepID=UPI0006F5D523|nr:D-alanine--D-alanine ligase [Rhodanobacter sp. Soil772]KRE85492.1 D-alanine--D-alanine ligase [Rhodanobacter sp. Soil772]
MSVKVTVDKISDPAQFGRVAVAMGGSSAEREVSLDSGRNVLEALKARGVDAHAVDGIPALLDALRTDHFARVFNILHGQHGGGEDGVLQGALEALKVPYTGSGVLGSALSMDKTRSKRVWQSLGLPTPKFVALPRGADVHAAAKQIGFPLIVKPACEGSSVGVTRVFEEAQLDQAVELAAKYPGDLLMETLIEGDELTVGILGRQVLPSIHIVPKGAFYDYNAKYIAEDTLYLCPGLEGDAEAELRALALAAFDALGCQGWGRVDVMRDRAGRNWLLEVNTAPGMTSHSLVPKAAKVAGIDYQELCWRVLETSFARESVTARTGFTESRIPNPESRDSKGGAQ